MSAPIIALNNVSKYFGSVIALNKVSFDVEAGEIHCLLGDNGAGKSTLIKVLSGVHVPDEGEILIDGKPVHFGSPKETLDAGIATVYQDLALVPLMSVSRNFFLGREPQKGWGIFRQFDTEYADRTTYDELSGMGIQLRSPQQPVGTLSGGERQCLAIARAIHFGARVLILDEPTSALGVHQASVVLKLVVQAKARGIGVVFISHNVHHAHVVGDRFTLLKRGRSVGTYLKDAITRDELLALMAGGKELVDLEKEIASLKKAASAGRA
ncbi:MAG: ATP-binding cassette domain-containing protein [Parvibaculaceae bacterium]